MKCKICGFECPEQTKFCPNCGRAVEEPQADTGASQVVEPVSLNPVADRVFAALKDKLFLVICILMTSYSVLSILSGALPVLQILFSVFLWLTYAGVQKGYADANKLRLISGTVYAQYVIINVACGILIVCGAIIGLAMTFASNMTELTETFAEALGEFDLDLYGISSSLVAISGWILGFLFVSIAAIFLLINILGMRKIHRFAKSVYLGIMFQNPNFENANAVKGWLMAFGIMSAISAVLSLQGGEILPAVATGCEAATAIIASKLIGKYLMPTVDNNIL